MADAQLFGSSYLKALIFSTVIDLRTLAQVVHVSDCFPSFMHFGKVFPVEEINKFQDDISFFIQKNKKKKKTNPLGYFQSLILTIFKKLSLNKGKVLCQRNKSQEIS